MPTPMEQLRSIEKQLFALYYASAVINYDDATVAPPESSEGRGEAVEVLSAADRERPARAAGRRPRGRLERAGGRRGGRAAASV